MKIDLSGKRAIVTGSSSGIGFAIAASLAAAGAHVVINGRRNETTESAVHRIRAFQNGASVEGVPADLATAQGVADFIARVPDADILVNNLGIYENVDFGEITDADWNRFFDTNLMSGVRLSRHYLPGMFQRNWGRLLFITSESAITPPSARIHYAATKAAQLALARGLAQTTRGTGVTSNSVVVGITRTEAVDDMITQRAREQGITEEQMDRNLALEHRPGQLLERLATSQEVANMVVYAASPQAAATNGSALRVEGGGIPTIF